MHRRRDRAQCGVLFGGYSRLACCLLVYSFVYLFGDRIGRLVTDEVFGLFKCGEDMVKYVLCMSVHQQLARTSRGIAGEHYSSGGARSDGWPSLQYSRLFGVRWRYRYYILLSGQLFGLMLAIILIYVLLIRPFIVVNISTQYTVLGRNILVNLVRISSDRI